jgi:hypothetical protein
MVESRFLRWALLVDIYGDLQLSRFIFILWGFSHHETSVSFSLILLCSLFLLGHMMYVKCLI